jgi:hypothetical protein
MNDMLTPRTPGSTLRAAREKRKLSCSEVAETTRLKVHVIESLEADDYRMIPAPLYGKGFIKLYAEAVGLDPEPLIRDYMERYAQGVRPSLRTEMAPPSVVNGGVPAPSPLARFKTTGVFWRDLGDALVEALRTSGESVMVAWIRLRRRILYTAGGGRRGSGRYAEAAPLPVGRYAALGFAVLVVAVLVTGFVQLFGTRMTPAKAPVPAVAAVPVSPRPKPAAPPKFRPVRLAEEPPEPYLKLKAP